MPTHSLSRQAIVLVLLCLPAVAQETCKHCPNPDQMNAQFPEAPSSETHHFFNKAWLGATAIQGAATGFDIAETLKHQGTCGLEGNNGFPERVTGKELAFNGGIELAFNVFVHALAYRAPRGFQWINYMTPAYGTAVHLRGGIQWYTRCH